MSDLSLEVKAELVTVNSACKGLAPRQNGITRRAKRLGSHSLFQSGSAFSVIFCPC